MARQGVILLGYARSAGSGDQPVQGTVTSRRDRGQQQRQKLLKQQQLEEERLVRQRQELAAQFLKKKWREQDTKRKEERRPAHYDSEEEEGEIRERPAPPKVEEAAEGRETHRSEGPSLQEGKWVSVGGGAACQQREQAAAGRATEAPKQVAITAKPTPAPDDPRQRQRKNALANAFRVDEEDAEARRELELAAKIKKARVEAREARVTEQTVVDTRPVPAAATAAPPAPRPMDMYEQMKKLAEWKRSCKGNRRPMPDDMVKAIAQSSGLVEPDSKAASSASSSRRRSRSRSRSGSPNRRPNDSQSRRSERGRSERDGARSRRSGRQSRSASRGSRAGTRATL